MVIAIKQTISVMAEIEFLGEDYLNDLWNNKEAGINGH
jgi:hypothetical protein